MSHLPFISIHCTLIHVIIYKTLQGFLRPHYTIFILWEHVCPLITGNEERTAAKISSLRSTITLRSDSTSHHTTKSKGQLKCDGTRAETRFRLSAKRTSPFKSAGGRQFRRLLAAEVCASAVVMLDTPCSEVVWRVLATHSIRQFPLHFPSRASPCAITFQLESTTVQLLTRLLVSLSAQKRNTAYTKLRVCFVSWEHFIFRENRQVKCKWRFKKVNTTKQKRTQQGTNISIISND